MSSRKSGFSRRMSSCKVSQPLVPKEKVLIALVCLQLALAIWSMALTHLWSELLFAALSVAGFMICLIPQQRDLRWQDPAQTTSAAWKRLRRFPLFWSGILLLLYIAIQGLNPAYGYEENPETWRSFPIDHLSWLPSSIASPFHKLNPWRMMLMLGAAWLFLCYSWTGLQRRRSLAFVLWFLFFNALAFCVLVIVQKQTGASGIYWNFEVYPNFFGTVPYKNRGAALLYLMMGCSMALYFYQVRIMRERLLRSGPHLIVLLGILVQYATLWSSFSRGGLAVATAMLFAFFLMILRTSFEEGDSPILKFLSIPICALLIVLAATAVPRLPDFEGTLQRFESEKLEKEVTTLDFNGRLIPTQITWEMIQYKPWFGWGAGSWRFVFPYYQLNYPEILNDGKIVRIWHDAHNDWAQYVSELGIVGTPFLLFFILWPVMFLSRNIRQSRCTHIMLAITLLGGFVHALIELLFQNLSILCLSATVIMLLLKLPYSRRSREHTNRLPGSIT